MKPKNFNFISILFSVLFGYFCALGGEAITSHVTIWPLIGYGWGGGGFAIAPNLDVVATSFGFGGELVEHEPVQMSLWDTLGQRLSSVIVTSNSPSFNGTHYDTIQPVVLTAGETYYLCSCGTDGGVWDGDVISANDHNGDFTVAPELNYIGMALATNAAGVFPLNVTTGANLAVGANLQFYPAPLIVVGGLKARNAVVQVDFNMWGRQPTSFTLLESAQSGGPWQTNTQAQLMTNIVGASYSFSTTPVGNVRFYRVQSP